jgi:hypothetical protein
MKKFLAILFVFAISLVGFTAVAQETVKVHPVFKEKAVNYVIVDQTKNQVVLEQLKPSTYLNSQADVPIQFLELSKPSHSYSYIFDKKETLVVNWPFPVGPTNGGGPKPVKPPLMQNSVTST